MNIDTFQLKQVFHLTFYAKLGTDAIAAFDLPSSTEGIYGKEWCDRSPDPALNGGFECDPDAWLSYIRAGWTYNLRDIDCFDESVTPARGAGVSWGLATGTACEP